MPISSALGIPWWFLPERNSSFPTRIPLLRSGILLPGPGIIHGLIGPGIWHPGTPSTPGTMTDGISAPGLTAPGIMTLGSGPRSTTAITVITAPGTVIITMTVGIGDVPGITAISCTGEAALSCTAAMRPAWGTGRVTSAPAAPRLAAPCPAPAEAALPAPLLPAREAPAARAAAL